MNKKALIAIPLCLAGFYGISTVTTAQDGCQLMDVPPVCQGGGQININNNSKNISPPNLCANPGETIEVNVTPAGTTASIDGKDGGWPRGSDASFTITAPAAGSYDYNVTFEDGSCIDPRIIVKD
jgi:plastocyanin